MLRNIKKWAQAQLIINDSVISKYFPETVQFSVEALQDFLNRYPFVYVKPDGGGQGKGIIRISSKTNGVYHVQGYSNNGEDISEKVNDLNQIKKMIQPTIFYEKHRSFILQQGINSISKDGLPLGIRVHTQKVQDKWMCSGMLGKLVSSEDGIVNRNRGAWAIPIRKLLTSHAGMDEKKAQEIENEITHISLKVSKLFADKYSWCEECGIDIGLNEVGKPYIFEVNTIPSTAFFYQLPDKSIYRQIFNNRRLKKQAINNLKNKPK
jgi:glutathione synthase/RimK-type ligase-like ATP-grasp enzyme